MDSQEFRDHKAVSEAHTRLVKSVEVLEAAKALGAHAGTDRSPRGQLLRKVEGMALERAFDALERLAADPKPADPPKPAGGMEYIMFMGGHLPAELMPLAEVLRRIPLNETKWREIVEAMPPGRMVQFGGHVLVVSLPAGTMKMG